MTSASGCARRCRSTISSFGVGIFNADGVCCYGTNTYIEELTAERLAGDAEATFAIDALDLVEGTYKLDVAVHKTRRLSVRLPPPALHLPREVAHQGRRHLPAAPRAGRFAGDVKFKKRRP